MILFLDFVCPKPYDPRVAAREPLGGTEATVTKIAEGLAGKLDVCVLQHNRKTHERFKANYVGVSLLNSVNPKHVVVLRQPKLIPFLRKQWPKAKIYLWMHDLANEALAYDLPVVLDCEASLIAVSQFHRQNILSTVRATTDLSVEIPIQVVYNPLDDDLAPNDTPVNPNKIVFFSSPHKGLENALNLFSCIKYRNPKIELFITNPGYLNDHKTDQKGVVNLGQIKKEDVIKNVREAFCVFYPNTVFPETFGLVYAEANAVGTPVLTHDLGAATEILNPSASQVVNCKDIKPVVDRFEAWQAYGRPVVSIRDEFKMSNVLASWEALFEAS